jgi:hypothetical protein
VLHFREIDNSAWELFAMTENDLEGTEFEFRYQAVGYFRATPPQMDGEASYAPLRGAGHHELQRALKAGPARCSYPLGDQRIHFYVINCPRYGVLGLSNFQSAPREMVYVSTVTQVFTSTIQEMFGLSQSGLAIALPGWPTKFEHSVPDSLVLERPQGDRISVRVRPVRSLEKADSIALAFEREVTMAMIPIGTRMWLYY